MIVCIATATRIFLECGEHAYDAATLFAFTAGSHPITDHVGGMAGRLMLLEMGVAFDQNLFDEQFRQRSQDGKLADSPTLAPKVGGKGCVEPDALVVETVVVANPLGGGPTGGVEFVADDQPAEASFAHQRQNPEEEHGDGP